MAFLFWCFLCIRPWRQDRPPSAEWGHVWYFLTDRNRTQTSRPISVFFVSEIGFCSMREKNDRDQHFLHLSLSLFVSLTHTHTHSHPRTQTFSHSLTFSSWLTFDVILHLTFKNRNARTTTTMLMKVHRKIARVGAMASLQRKFLYVGTDCSDFLIVQKLEILKNGWSTD